MNYDTLITHIAIMIIIILLHFLFFAPPYYYCSNFLFCGVCLLVCLIMAVYCRAATAFN